MEIALIVVTFTMFLLAAYAEGRHRANAGLRVVTWEEFARSHNLDVDRRQR